MNAFRQRSARQVLEDHLRRRCERDVEEDIARNYAEDVVLLTGFGVFRGHAGVRRSAQILDGQLPCAKYHYRTKQTDGPVAFLEWTARCRGAAVKDGADSFFIHEGRIVAQTIHYTVRKRARPKKAKRPRKTPARPGLQITDETTEKS
jgi:hypothetical protein